MFYTNPDMKSAHLIIYYRNFMAVNSNYCHVGLGVNALHTAKVLRRQGMRVDVQGVREPADIEKHLDSLLFPPTHVLIEAPWITIPNLGYFLSKYHTVHFVVRAHSQIGFLQVEAGAIDLIRQMILLQESALNFTNASNSERLIDFLNKTYTGNSLFLPNLYDLERVHRKRDTDHQYRRLLIGSFGALRLLKNHTTAAAAAMMIAERRRCDLEFYVSVNREENPGSKGILQAIRNMFARVPWATLVESPWEPWASFRRTVAAMDLCMQTSFTETFNLATADATAEGVPVVVSSAIEWAPSHWMASVDDAADCARVGMALLSDPQSAEEGLKALRSYVERGTAIWLKYLGSNPT